MSTRVASLPKETNVDTRQEARFFYYYNRDTEQADSSLYNAYPRPVDFMHPFSDYIKI